jgi:hypothetical protein
MRCAEQGHITDRFTKAVEQLGSDKMAVRLGAIYALERISKDSPRDHWSIMETLTAYVREHAPWPPRQALTNPFVELQGRTGETAGESTPAEEPANAVEPASSRVRPTTDIQAILTVLGRCATSRYHYLPRSRRQKLWGWATRKQWRQLDFGEGQLDLTETDLRGADLPRSLGHIFRPDGRARALGMLSATLIPE